MIERFEDHRQWLRNLNLILKHQLETAEAVIPELNALINQLGNLGLADTTIILGDAVLEEPYAPNENRSESCQIIQAGLLVPHGIGAVIWDREEYVDNRNDPNIEIETQLAVLRFRSFDNCWPMLKALLIPQAKNLLTQLQSHFP